MWVPFRLDSNQFAGLKSATEALARFDAGSLDNGVYSLQQYTTLFNMWQVAEELGLARDEKLTELLPTKGVDEFLARALNLIGGGIDLDTDWMYEQFYENDCGRLDVLLQPLGLNAFWGDEFFDAITDPENYFDGLPGVLVFFGLLDNGLEEGWEECSEFFGWGVPEAPEFIGKLLDYEKFCDLMTGMGYGDFLAATEVAAANNNPYFFTTPDYDPPEMTTDLILALREDHKDAVQTLKTLEKCERRVKRRRRIYKDILTIWQACLQKPAPERARVRV